MGPGISPNSITRGSPRAFGGSYRIAHRLSRHAPSTGMMMFVSGPLILYQYENPFALPLSSLVTYSFLNENSGVCVAILRVAGKYNIRVTLRST